nr:ACT domain-containing protein DS12, chloroplastic-like [Tanacetum cinerariifolium]
MVASMASFGFAIKVHKDLTAFSIQPTFKSAVFTSSVGSNHGNNLCLTVSHKSRWSYATVIPKASATALEDEVYVETDEVPVPKVIIDQDSDLDATVVEVTFGDRLGALLDTMGALTNLGLNVVKANVHLDSSGKHTKFAITKASTGRKVDEPELLEAIRLTIISNLLEYHPESSAHLAMGEAFGIEAPKHKLDVDIATHIHVYDDGPNRSLLSVETADRPGLLLDLVKIFNDVNVAVESGEFDTEVIN